MTTVHFTANNTFCILNRDFANTLRDRYNKDNHRQSYHREQNHVQNVNRAGLQILENNMHSIRKPGNDTSKDDQRDTVTDTFRRNLFTDPHQKYRTSS